MTNQPLLPTTPLIRASEAANLLGIKTTDLAQARFEGRGPAFVRIGKEVRYSREVVLTHRDARESADIISSAELAQLLDIEESRLLDLSERGEFLKGRQSGGARTYRVREVHEALLRGGQSMNRG